MKHPSWNRIASIWAGLTLAAALLLRPGGIRAADTGIGREEGEFKIYAAGKEIGTEKYEILASNDAATSSSTVTFRNPGDRHQKVQLETKLDMDGHYLPKTYQLRSDVDGQKGTIRGEFSPHQVMFQYVGNGVPRKSGLLLGDQYTVLDTNVFHHFVFLARLFNYGTKGKGQDFEVVIPQEQDNGELRITELEKENITLRGKKMEARHLKIDSGSVIINLWVDAQKTVQKITVPDRQIEVVRDR